MTRDYFIILSFHHIISFTYLTFFINWNIDEDEKIIRQADLVSRRERERKRWREREQEQEQKRERERERDRVRDTRDRDRERDEAIETMKNDDDDEMKNVLAAK